MVASQRDNLLAQFEKNLSLTFFFQTGLVRNTANHAVWLQLIDSRLLRQLFPDGRVFDAVRDAYDVANCVCQVSCLKKHSLEAARTSMLENELKRKYIIRLVSPVMS